MRDRPGSLAALLLTVAAACGPGQAPPSTTAIAAPSASVRATPAPPAEDRTKVAAPAGLFAHVHVESPWSAAASIGACAPRVFDKLNVGKLAELIVGSSALARHVDFRRPMDLAIAAGPPGRRGRDELDVVWAFAFDPADLEPDVDGLFTLEKLPGGVRRLQLARDRRDAEPELRTWRHACVIAPAIGDSPYRLVCTEQRRAGALDRLAPWLARGVTADASAGPAMHAWIDLDAIRARYRDSWDRARDELESWVGGLVHSGYEQVDRAAKRLGRRAADDLFDTLDDARAIELSAEPGADGLAITGALRLSTTSAWTSRLLLAAADAPGGPRPEHRGLFGDKAHSGGFSRASRSFDPLYGALVGGANDLLDALAHDLKWSPQDGAAWSSLVARALGPSVDRAWVDVVPASAQGPSAPGSTKGDLLEGAVRSALAPGVSLSVEERPAAQEIALAKALGAQLASPTTARAIKALTDGALVIDARVSPESTTALPPGSFAQKLALSVSIADAGAVRPGWPQKIDLVQLVIPDGDRCWTAVARRTPTSEAIALLNAARKAGAPTALALEPVLAPSGALGSFATIRSLANAASQSTEVADFLAKLPNAGQDPLVVRLAAAREGAGGVARVTLLLPRDVVAAAGLGLETALRWFF